jgi:hypothetical protein
MSYTRDEISPDLQIEKDILTGMIINTDFLREVVDRINPKLFKIDYIRTVSQWVLAYYKKYKAAPLNDLKSIYAAESIKLKPAEAEIIQTLLQDLSDRYQEGDPFNKDYWVDKAIFFCKDRALENLEQRINGYRLRGDVDKAEEAVRGYNKISKATSRWVNPFDPDEIEKTFEDNETDKLFMLPGVLGELIGFLRRGWLISILAPTKTGKSFYAQEIIYQGLVLKLKAVMFSFEMSSTENKMRFYKRLTAMAEEGGEYAYPIFDCLYNQEGSCNLSYRQNKIKLVDTNGMVPIYKKGLKYGVCDYCRKDQGLKDKYKPATWWQTQIQKTDLSPDIIKKKVAGFKKMFGANLRIIAPPSFSAGFDFINTELDRLEYDEGFVPDIILVDSFDITEQEVQDELQDQNIKSMRGKRLAGERHVLVMNCDQGNRDSMDQVNIKQKHTQGTIKRLQNVDVELTLNQTEDEKEQGVMRIGVLLNRHDASKEKGQVYVLQQLELGMPNIDSEWVDKKRRRK